MATLFVWNYQSRGQNAAEASLPPFPPHPLSPNPPRLPVVYPTVPRLSNVMSALGVNSSDPVELCLSIIGKLSLDDDPFSSKTATSFRGVVGGVSAMPESCRCGEAGKAGGDVPPRLNHGIGIPFWLTWLAALPTQGST
ncbi:hypothetical protein HDU96_004811, partial [Phlyctochytrium bullatum]